MKRKHTPERHPALVPLWALLRSGLWDRPLPEGSFAPLTAPQWQQLYTISARQGILGLVHRGITHLPPALQPPAPLASEWSRISRSIALQHYRIHQVRNEVLSLLSAHHITAVVFKGDAIATLYPQPTLRMNGDIDLWFPHAADIPRAEALLREAGYKTEHPGNHHSIVEIQGIPLELHHDFMNLPLKARVPRSWQWAERPDFRAPVLHDKADTVQLLTHAAHHFIETGLGLRHLCDWAVWIQSRRHSPELQQGLLEIRRLGAGPFLDAFTSLTCHELALELPAGLPVHLLPKDSSRVRLLLREMLLQGNLGHDHLRQKAKSRTLISFYFNSMLREFRLAPYWPRYVLAGLPHQFVRSLRQLRFSR